MRSRHKATAIVAALGIAFGVTACGTDTQPGALPTATPTQAPAAQGSPRARGIDSSLISDLKNMATAQETYIVDNPNEMGVPVTANKPDGHAGVDIGGSSFFSTPGNVIAVKIGPAGYCVSGYNKAATKATSATESMLYKSDSGGIQAAVGVC